MTNRWEIDSFNGLTLGQFQPGLALFWPDKLAARALGANNLIIGFDMRQGKARDPN